jgi:uncharacterized protein
MKYLLDVSVLVALTYDGHEFNERVSRWVGKERATFLTCSLTELGMLRILCQPAYNKPSEIGRGALLRLKASTSPRFEFLADDADMASLRRWVKGPKQLTDGHLLDLAKKHGAELATLDERIPGAYLVPRRN